MKDSQRKAVYRWGWTLQRAFTILDEVMEREDIVALVKRIFREYGRRQAPTVVFNGRANAWARGSSFQISLPAGKEWAHKRCMILHEAAHGLVAGDHGPRYARVFLDLMARYAGVSAIRARAIGVHQKPRRVRFAKAADVPQRRSAAWIRWNDKLRDLQRQVREHKEKEPGR